MESHRCPDCGTEVHIRPLQETAVCPGCNATVGFDWETYPRKETSWKLGLKKSPSDKRWDWGGGVRYDTQEAALTPSTRQEQGHDSRGALHSRRRLPRHQPGDDVSRPRLPILRRARPQGCRASAYDPPRTPWLQSDPGARSGVGPAIFTALPGTLLGSSSPGQTQTLHKAVDNPLKPVDKSAALWITSPSASPLSPPTAHAGGDALPPRPRGSRFVELAQPVLFVVGGDDE